jgi:acetyl-CoA acetyltransferase
MPKVIANKLTGETMPDTAENRIATFRGEFRGDYRAYKEKYETVIYGIDYGLSNLQLIERYGLTEKHNAEIKRLREERAAAQAKKEKERADWVSVTLSDKMARKLLLELYEALDSYTQGEALSTIESYKDDADYCNSYR